MDLVYYRAPALNFGDDLNPLIWDAVLPARVKAADIVLVGIGSILAQWCVGHLADERRPVFVVGSGTSYGQPPRDLSRWHVSAVRGPITGALIGRPEAAVTDGAILLAATDLVRRAPDAGEVLFMPHRASLPLANWEAVAGAAGMRFVSPETPVEAVLERFAQAKLVVAEAMHAAIVADTLRIPWVPVALTPAVEELKWRDWTRSMELPYRPVFLPPSSSAEWLAHRRTRRTLARHELGTFPQLEHETDAEALRAHLWKRFGKAGPALRGAPKAASGWRGRIKATASLADPALIALAARALARAGQSHAYLSDDAVFRDRLDRMMAAVHGIDARV